MGRKTKHIDNLRSYFMIVMLSLSKGSVIVGRGSARRCRTWDMIVVVSVCRSDRESHSNPVTDRALISVISSIARSFNRQLLLIEAPAEKVVSIVLCPDDRAPMLAECGTTECSSTRGHVKDSTALVSSTVSVRLTLIASGPSALKTHVTWTTGLGLPVVTTSFQKPC